MLTRKGTPTRSAKAPSLGPLLFKTGISFFCPFVFSLGFFQGGPKRAKEIPEKNMKKTRGLKKQLGLHLIAEFMEPQFPNLSKIKKILKEAVLATGAKFLGGKYHQFDKEGKAFSAIALLSESHISLHSWPEEGYLAVDVFTCGKETYPQKAIEVFKKYFKPKKIKIKVQKRGVY